MIKRLIVALTLGLSLWCIPSEASAQDCTTGLQPAYDDSPRGMFRVAAFTVKLDCLGTRTETYLEWIAQATHCSYWGTFATGGGWWALDNFCYGEDYDGSQSYIGSTAARSGCGYLNGYSAHFWRVNSSIWVSSAMLFGPYETPLYAGICNPPPAPDGYQCGAGWVWDPQLEEWVCISPILIPTGNGQNFPLTSKTNGVHFDFNGDGVSEQMAWTEAGSDLAFLALDLNGDGNILTGSELIGNRTVPGARNGFDALSDLQFAESGVRRGSISSDDPLYYRLLLWTDRNHDGVSQPSELQPFSERFASIGLAYELRNRQDGHGNTFRFEGFVLDRTKPGRNKPTSAKDAHERNRKVYDVYFTSQK